MKIQEIKIANFKGLDGEVNINISGQSLIIFGKNGKGKSSFIDGIWAALQSGNIPIKPINANADKSVLELTLDQGDGRLVKVKRKFTQSGNSLSVSMGQFEVGKPASYLNKLVGKDINFDPIQFAQYSKTPKGRVLQSGLVQDILKIDLTKWDNKIKQVEEMRLVSFRSKKDLDAKVKVSAEAMPQDQDVYKEKVSVSQLMESRKKHDAILANVAKAIAKKTTSESSIESESKRLEDKKLQLKKLQEEISDIEAKILAHKESVKKCETYIDDNQKSVDQVKSIDEAIANADAHNSNYQKIKDHADLLEAAEKEDLNHKNLNANIKDLRKQKQAEIEAKCAELDLGKKIYITEDGRLYINQVPIEQLNTAQQIEVGLLLYMNSNPKVRIIRLEVSTLDEETLSIVQKLIVKHDFQAFMERVDSSDDDLHYNIIEE